MLRRYDADVPPTPDGRRRFGCGHALRPSMSVIHAVFCGCRTQWVVVSAGIAQERVVMARSHMPDDAKQAPTAVGGTSAS